MQLWIEANNTLIWWSDSTYNPGTILALQSKDKLEMKYVPLLCDSMYIMFDIVFIISNFQESGV